MKYTLRNWTFNISVILVLILSSCAVKKNQNTQELLLDTPELSAKDSLMYQQGLERSVNEKLRKKHKKTKK
ncbi:MAG: hypothetical protein COA99_11950 [Moraxellaceae bacterium]|nr:MAG: hypothetical protein COA99_11950 [Moraxellaceae bacterium]